MEFEEHNIFQDPKRVNQK